MSGWRIALRSHSACAQKRAVARCPRGFESHLTNGILSGLCYKNELRSFKVLSTALARVETFGLLRNFRAAAEVISNSSIHYIPICLQHPHRRLTRNTRKDRGEIECRGRDGKPKQVPEASVIYQLAGADMAQCMIHGLREIQSYARASARRERPRNGCSTALVGLDDDGRITIASHQHLVMARISGLSMTTMTGFGAVATYHGTAASPCSKHRRPVIAGSPRKSYLPRRIKKVPNHLGRASKTTSTLTVYTARLKSQIPAMMEVRCEPQSRPFRSVQKMSLPTSRSEILPNHIRSFIRLPRSGCLAVSPSGLTNG